jgi:predicted transposase/invertase (TIGR01784 family)
MRFSPRVKYVLMKLFGLEENKMLLKSLINAILSPDEQLNEIILVYPNNNEKDTWCDKFYIPEIKGIDKKGCYCNIEIKVEDHSTYGKYKLEDWTELYSDQLEEGDEYSMLRKTICIYLFNFDCFENKKDYHHVFRMLDTKLHDGYAGDMEYHFIELEKCHKNVYEPENRLDYWASFLATVGKYERHDLPEIFKNDLEMRAAFIALERLYLDRGERKIYENQKESLQVKRSYWKRDNRRRRLKCLRCTLIELIRDKFGDIPYKYLSIIELLDDKERILDLYERVPKVGTLREMFK